MKLNKKIFVFLIISIIVYASFLILSDFNKLADKITDFKIEYLPLILILVPLGWLALYARWVFLLRNLNYILPHKQNFKIFLSGFALGVTPGKVGELLKCQLLKDSFDVPKRITAPVILIERFYNAVGIVIISIFGIWFFDFSGIVILIIACILVIIFILLRSKKLFSSVIQKTSKTKFISKFSNSFSDSYDVINLSIKPKIFIVSSLFSASYWILESFGINFIEFYQVIITYATSIILGVASFIPAGIGVFEGTLIGLLSIQGLTISSAVALAIFVRVFTLWYSVLVGFFALKFSGALSLNSD